MVVSGHLYDLIGSAICGGAVTGVGWWRAGRKERARRESQHQRVWDFLTGTPASQGVPATPSLADRLETAGRRLDAVEAKADGAAAEAKVVAHKQKTMEAGVGRWTEAYDRKLAGLGRRVRKLEPV